MGSRLGVVKENDMCFNPIIDLQTIMEKLQDEKISINDSGKNEKSIAVLLWSNV